MPNQQIPGVPGSQQGRDDDERTSTPASSNQSRSASGTIMPRDPQEILDRDRDRLGTVSHRGETPGTLGRTDTTGRAGAIGTGSTTASSSAGRQGVQATSTPSHSGHDPGTVAGVPPIPRATTSSAGRRRATTRQPASTTPPGTSVGAPAGTSASATGALSMAEVKYWQLLEQARELGNRVVGYAKARPAVVAGAAAGLVLVIGALALRGRR